MCVDGRWLCNPADLPDLAAPPDLACALDPQGVDFYVDVNGADGGNGSAGCPVRTITEGLQLAAASTAAARTVHVAAGTYDAASGEVFPLVVRGWTTVVGAGIDKTIVRGTGSIDHSAAGGPYNGSYDVTFVAGDDTAMVWLNHMTLDSGDAVVSNTSAGIFCDLGNTPQGPPPIALSSPSLYTDNLAITNYQWGALIGGGLKESGPIASQSPPLLYEQASVA